MQNIFWVKLTMHIGLRAFGDVLAMEKLFTTTPLAPGVVTNNNNNKNHKLLMSRYYDYVREKEATDRLLVLPSKICA